MGAIKSAFDGWSNIFSGMGTRKDKKEFTVFNGSPLLSEPEIDDLYTNDGFARKIVDRYTSDMLRKRFYVEGDPENKIPAHLDDINAWPEIDRLIRYNQLYGGAVCIKGIDDGGRLEDPVNMNTILNLIFLRTYSRYRVSWEPKDIYTDPMDQKYGKVQIYTINPGNGQPSYRVHESRVIVKYGLELPETTRRSNKGWGASKLQQCHTQLRQLGAVYPALQDIVEDYITSTINVTNLQEMMLDPEGETKILARLELIDMSKHICNTVLLDENEKHEKKSSSVAGLPEVIDKFLQALSTVSELPSRILVGEQGGGMNNNGDGETRDWYDQISADQKRDVIPVQEDLCRVIFNSKQGPFGGKEPEGWVVINPPLWQSTEKEIAEIRKLNSEADTNYANAGILSNDEIATSRFATSTYGTEIRLIDGTDRSKKVEPKTPVKV